MLTYDFRLPPGPRTVEYAILAENLGFRAVWCPEVPAFGHDIWVTLARIAEKTKRIKFGPSVLIPSYRHPMAQASAIATLEQIAPGRLMVGFGTGFTGRAGMGKKPLSLASMRTHIAQVKALLRGDIADIDGGLAQILASDGWLPDRPINVPVYMAGQGPKARALALVQMAATDQLHWRAELAEVVDGQAEGGSGAVRGSPLRPRSHHPVRALVSSVQAQSARLGRNDGRARPVDGAYHDHALGAALCPGVRETLAPVCPGGRPVMAGRRDLRQDPRRVALPISCR